MEGLESKKEKDGEGGRKTQGVGKEKSQGRIRVCSRVCLAGLLGLASWAALSLAQNIFFYFFLFQNNLAIKF